MIRYYVVSFELLTVAYIKTTVFCAVQSDRN
jgi:hypothetical protein